MRTRCSMHMSIVLHLDLKRCRNKSHNLHFQFAFFENRKVQDHRIHFLVVHCAPIFIFIFLFQIFLWPLLDLINK